MNEASKGVRPIDPGEAMREKFLRPMEETHDVRLGFRLAFATTLSLFQ